MIVQNPRLNQGFMEIKGKEKRKREIKLKIETHFQV
jgi:hypothetical protein